MRQASPQQQAVLDFLPSQQNISVHALAGTGKTSLIEMCQPLRSGLNIAFNAVIRKEFQARMPDAESHTFNSFGHKVIGKAVRIKFNESKMKDIRDALKVKWADSPDFMRIMDIARGSGFGFGEHALVDAADVGNWQDLIDSYFLESSIDPTIFIDALKMDLKLCWEGVIDYGDQLWFPILAHLSLGYPYPVVYVDEAQDVNAIQIEMIKRMAGRKETQIVLVGDPNQAIYGFRGSVSDSMSVLEAAVSAQPFPLSVSFRCPKSVVAEARQWVPDFSAAPDNDEGEVRTLEGWDSQTFPPGAVVLCRNNAPIITLALQMISQGKPASVRGRDIGKSLVTLAKRVAEQYNPRTRDEYLTAVMSWRDREISGRESREAAVTEKAEALMALLRGCGETASPAEIQRKTETLFTDKAGILLFSTIHKAKGLEWKEVFFLDRDLIPSRFAKTTEQIQQENNLLYVGVTRAKQRLTWIYSQDQI